MNSIYTKILLSKQKNEKLLAILIDPDKTKTNKIKEAVDQFSNQLIDFIFVGGSTVKNGATSKLIAEIKKYTKIPIVLFPGDYSQISENSDAILFLSLLSGRNPEYLINQQVKSVPLLKKSDLEIISTGYILVDGGIKTAVQKVSNTTPIPQENIEEIVNTACAGMYMGNKIIYLEAGSGAKTPVRKEIIQSVSNELDIPLIVGGGIRTRAQLNTAYQNGADIVVLGTVFEENKNVLSELLKLKT